MPMHAPSPSHGAASSKRLERLPSTVPVRLFWFAVVTVLMLFFQTREGAFRSEFGGHPDEAAHYVTGLFVRDALVMVKDYALSGFHGSPVQVGKGFATSFYEHYPKVGLGNWPPFYYLVQSAWTLSFGESRASVMVLMAVLAGWVGSMIYGALREEAGPVLAGLGALLWVMLPVVQQFAGMMMTEVLGTLLMFGATLRFGRYLDEGRGRDVYAFAGYASLAILTKGTGVALALVALGALLLTGRYERLKERSLWLAAGLVALVGGPWTLATRNLAKAGWEEPAISWHFTRLALPYYGWKVLVVFGVLLSVLAGGGLVARLWPREEERRGKWAACFSLALGLVVFQSIVPAGREVRHLVPMIPAVLLFAVAGLAVLLRWVRGTLVPSRGAELLLVALVLWAIVVLPGMDRLNGWLRLSSKAVPHYGSVGDALALSPFRIGAKPQGGFQPVVEQLMGLPPVSEKETTLLVSSDASGEGMFIAEVAMRDQRRAPRFFARRASKELAASSWSGGGYQPKYADDAALLAWLTSGAVDVVVIDTAIPARNLKEHHTMLQRVVEANPSIFTLAALHPLTRGGEAAPGEARAYRVRPR